MIIRYTSKAEKELARINKPEAIKIKEKLNHYIEGTESTDVIHLTGYSNLYRLRSGNYRVIFEFLEEDVIILQVLHIKHRSEVYKNLILAFIIFIFCAFTISAFAQRDEQAPSQSKDDIASAKVIEIINQGENKALETTFESPQMLQKVKVFVLNGEYKGKTLEVENQLTSNPVYDIDLKPGMRVLLDIEKASGGTTFYIADIERFPVLMVVLGVFLFLLLVIGGKKGFRSIISLGITALLIFFALVPAILNGFPSIPAAILVSIISTLTTMTIIGGFNLKSLAASLGTIISVSIAGFIAMVIIHSAALNGFHDQEAAMLWSARPDLNFAEILAASVIIAALGAVMDIGISIASSIAEFKNIDKNLRTIDLVKSGMNVGKDIMGAMSATLILAYLGGSFTLVLLATNAPFVKLVNLSLIVTEIASALTGSIGIVLCVPITAVIAGYLMGRKGTSQTTPPPARPRSQAPLPPQTGEKPPLRS